MRSKACHRLCILIECIGNNLCNVFDLQLVFGLNALDTVVEHGDAEWAGGGNHFGIGLQCLVDTRLINAFAHFFLHPSSTTTTTTTEALVAMTAHLCDTVSVNDVQYMSWLIVDVVVASDVTRIVIGQFTLVKAFR